MRNKVKIFLIPVAVFLFSFLLLGRAQADQCIRGDCKATCGSNEEPSTSPGDTCTSRDEFCCVPKACPSKSLLGCIPSSSCQKPTPGGSCYQSGQTCCDVEKTVDTESTFCKGAVNGASCTTTDGKIGKCAGGFCSAGASGAINACADLVNGAACTTSDGKAGTCKGGSCSSGASASNNGSKNSGGNSNGGSGWNSSELGSFGLPESSVYEIITNILDWLLTIIGILAIIALVISGIQYYLVATDEKMLETAKKTMRAAITGLIVALSGFIVIKAVDAMLNVQTLF